MTYEVCGRTVYVKREDLCINKVAFSKVRGVYSHMKKRPESVIGVLDTYHSKAGWGCSVIGKKLNKMVVVYYPFYKGQTELRKYQVECLKNLAEVRGLPAGRSCILYHQAKKHLKENYPNSYMMPNALQLPESISENSKEVMTVPADLLHDTTVVISISSGTIAMGVLNGFNLRNSNNDFHIHMGYSRSMKTVIKNFYEIVLPTSTIFGRSKIRFDVIDEGYNYKDFVKYDCPFPCNPYYDLKAWKWMCENINNEKLFPKKEKILFWNIGA